MVGERIKVNLEPLHVKIFALTELMDRLTSGYPGRKFTTANTRKLRLQSESPIAEAPGVSRFPLVAPLTTGYSPKVGVLFRWTQSLEWITDDELDESIDDNRGGDSPDEEKVLVSLQPMPKRIFLEILFHD